jgi:hypothetical protein
MAFVENSLFALQEYEAEGHSQFSKIRKAGQAALRVESDGASQTLQN